MGTAWRAQETRKEDDKRKDWYLLNYLTLDESHGGLAFFFFFLEGGGDGQTDVYICFFFFSPTARQSIQ
jgi:hypothetical protein